MLHDAEKFLLIAGPCAIESKEQCFAVAKKLQDLRERFPQVQFVFKGSFDKANRTRLDAPRGVGIDKGLQILNSVKQKYGFPCLTDVHLPEQCNQVAEVCEVLQIPAFLCRQTDLLVAAAKTGRCVNVKKGQFISPREMSFVCDKLSKAGASEIWLTERGNTFGYQNLVVDMRSFQIMNRLNCPTIMDATHGVQLPGAGDGASGGEREFIPALAKAAVAAGASGLFLETHPEPEKAISDSATQLPLTALDELLRECVEIWKIVRRKS